MSSSIVAAAAALREALSGFEPDTFSGADCALIVDELATTEKACSWGRLRAAQHAVECNAHEQEGFQDGAEWLATRVGITPGEAKRNLNTAGRLGDKTREALRAGKLSLDQAEEITNTNREVPGSEDDLIDLVEKTNLSRLREEGRDRRLAAIKPEELHERQHKARRFRATRDELGMICFSGALQPETGVPFLTRLEREADRIRKEARQADGEIEAWGAYAADAFVRLLVEGTDGSRPHPGQTDLTIVCDLRAWRRGHAHEGEPCHILDGGPIPVDLAKELGEDAFLNVAFHDGFELAKFARLGRHIPAALRAALDIGDPPDFTGKKCTDCGKRHRLELDHVDPVANGGRTSYQNLKPRCYMDHQAKTERDRRAGLLGPQAPRPPNTS